MAEIPYGYCHCGCGEKTRLADRTVPSIGHIKGQPVRFLRGHSTRGRKLACREKSLYEVDEETGCWNCLRTPRPNGYCVVKVGIQGVDRRNVLAHRYVYEQEVGPLDAAVHLHHECENKRCVNPEHLNPLTPRDHHRQHAKLNAQQVEEIRSLAAQGVARKELASRFEVALPTICNIINRKQWA